MRKNKLIALFCLATLISGSLIGCGTNITPNAESAADYTSPMNIGEESYVFEEVETYKNHIEILDEKTGRSNALADPCIVRFDGKYYMYNTGDSEGIKVYESEDLVNWIEKGYAAKNPTVAGGFAPEVVYYNGTFYMATSPGGQGHYMLSSDSPTGPFEFITENFGRGIDGSFYVGDDGEFYFVSPAETLKISTLDKETMIPGSGTSIIGTLNHWTEAPELFRRGDILYITYSGNHFASEGYRVGYSYNMNEDDPMGEYVMPYDNIIILNTGDESFTRLGHNMNIVGPNLDAWYTAYHNFPISAPHRFLMVDQLTTNGASLLVNGPTYSEVAVPKRPDFETREAEDGFISDKSTSNIYTIEYNVTPKATSNVEFIFAYEDDKNYATVQWSMQNETIKLIATKDGQTTELQSAEVKGMVADKLHTIRVEKGVDKLEVYLDTMQKIEIEIDSIGAGNIGVKGDVDYSYIAFTNEVYGTSDFETIKNIPSAFPAVHYLKGENRGWSIKNAKVVKGGIRQGEAENTVKNEEDAISALVLDTENDWVKYAVNATEDSYYGLAGIVTADSAGARIQVVVDEKDVYTFTVPEIGETSEEYNKVMIGKVSLTAGNHTLKIRLYKGKLQVQTFEMQPVNPTEITYETALDEMNTKGWSYRGNWKIVDGAHAVKKDHTVFAFAGDDKVTDFSMEVEVAMLEEGTINNGGILFHARNLSISDDQVPESLQGYYLGIQNDQITLNRYNYGGEIIEIAPAYFAEGEYHNIKIEMRNNHIRVYLDDTEIMNYYDPNAFLTGQIGLCSYQAAIAFKNFKIKTFN